MLVGVVCNGCRKGAALGVFCIDIPILSEKHHQKAPKSV